jgi:plastocyanin
MRRRLTRAGVLAAVAASVLAFAMAGASVARAPSVGIAGNSISNYKFKPATVHIDKGGSVSWSWNSNAPHNITLKKLGKHSKTQAKGSYSLRFAQKGTYRYICTIHDFKGKVVVG